MKNEYVDLNLIEIYHLEYSIKLAYSILLTNYHFDLDYQDYIKIIRAIGGAYGVSNCAENPSDRVGDKPKIVSCGTG